MTLENRVAVTAVGIILADGAGNCCEVLMDYHERQAEGGAGLADAVATAK
jgi:2,4-dienoyl-CoA reductase-like NADH-dependent reductase (Old Yellow Enzyme family)